MFSVVNPHRFGFRFGSFRFGIRFSYRRPQRENRNERGDATAAEYKIEYFAKLHFALLFDTYLFKPRSDVERRTCLLYIWQIAVSHDADIWVVAMELAHIFGKCCALRRCSCVLRTHIPIATASVHDMP